MSGTRQHVPLHAEFAAGAARGFDEANFEHDLLRRRDLNRIDDVRPELLGDGQRAVEHDGVGRGARQHDAAVDRARREVSRVGKRRAQFLAELDTS